MFNISAKKLVLIWAASLIIGQATLLFYLISRFKALSPEASFAWNLFQLFGLPGILLLLLILYTVGWFVARRKKGGISGPENFEKTKRPHVALVLAILGIYIPILGIFALILGFRNFNNRKIFSLATFAVLISSLTTGTIFSNILARGSVVGAFLGDFIYFF